MKISLTALGDIAMLNGILAHQILVSLTSFLFFAIFFKKVYTIQIADMNHLKRRFKNECAEIDENAELLHRFNIKFAKRIEICITNGGQFINAAEYNYCKHAFSLLHADNEDTSRILCMNMQGVTVRTYI